jgi:hypothetical protein
VGKHDPGRLLERYIAAWADWLRLPVGPVSQETLSLPLISPADAATLLDRWPSGVGAAGADPELLEALRVFRRWDAVRASHQPALTVGSVCSGGAFGGGGLRGGDFSENGKYRWLDAAQKVVDLLSQRRAGRRTYRLTVRDEENLPYEWTSDAGWEGLDTKPRNLL